LSWPVVVGLILAYWLLLFRRMRTKSRHVFDRAVDEAALAHPGRESFDVTVSTEVRPLHTAVVVLAVPIAFVVIHLLLSWGAAR